MPEAPHAASKQPLRAVGAATLQLKRGTRRPAVHGSRRGGAALTLIGVVENALAKIAVHNGLAGVARVVPVQE